MSDSDGMSELPPFPDSLCHGCAARRYVKTKTSTFVMCTVPEMAKYPPQPVCECAAFRPADQEAAKGSP
jgi:hypothetical protein